MDALELLRSDHDTVRELFKQFESAHENEDVERMTQLKEQIFAELRVHTAIEEELFYPAAEDEDGDEVEELVHEGVEEHHVVKVLMDEIEGLEPSDDAWAAKMTVLIENVEHHAEEEEEELFPKVRASFGEERLAQMGQQLEEAKRRHQQGTASQGPSPDTSSMSKEELYDKAKELDVQGRSQMTKDELAEAVEEE